MRMTKSTRILIALAGIAILAFAAWESGRRGLEDWRSMRSRRDVAGWGGGAAAPSEAYWLRNVQTLRDTLRRSPRDPEIWETLGKAYEFGSRKFAPPGWTAYDEFALIHYRQAAALRPTSPYSWAGIAVLKLRLNQLDPEFSAALVNAMQYGPWEPGIQMLASDFGLSLWDRMDPAFRALMNENFRRTAVHQADQLVKSAILRGRVGVLCDLSLDSLKNRLKCPG